MDKHECVCVFVCVYIYSIFFQCVTTLSFLVRANLYSVELHVLLEMIVVICFFWEIKSFGELINVVHNTNDSFFFFLIFKTDF